MLLCASSQAQAPLMVTFTFFYILDWGGGVEVLHTCAVTEENGEIFCYKQ